MQFDLRKFIEAGARPYHAEYLCDLSARDFAGARIPKPVSVCFDAVPDGGEVQMTLRANASVHGECARCLDPVERAETVCVEWTVRQRDLDDPDFELPLDEAGRLNVDEWLYQEFLFQIPTVLLCSAECQGLCPRCGKKMADCVCQRAQDSSAPIDARLSVLKSLLN
ncbi:MAG: DUF177 domain-containing protein [Candidatus Faecalibacterium intestinavium]|uniref:DUF177 domain-containing protein n=1 Tax=Candidatus Faecalibacterium intestinavium TaxID=2838580 RepID=A0A9E2KK19_9FIRM|nr:DUF177 domain-containing protein [Candidatus Faecalibacterium intestinavium]